MIEQQKQSPSRRSLLIAAGVLVLVGAALLALDLANHGLAWRVMWSLTGEEAPLAQVRGMVEWLGNVTRDQPNTAPDVPIQHAGVNPYGINTFLEQEVEPVKRERQIQMIAEAGFHWIRQEIPWQDIEIHARGDFIDRRNNPDGIDAWAKYDQIVDLAEQYGLEIQARIDKPPAWSRSYEDETGYAPPDNWDDYINFVTTFATRYQGRIHHYQIWNEPNIYPEWGNNPVDPEGYTQVLCRAYAALKTVDPSNVVISAALSPTIALTTRDLNEFIFLQRMYDAGAADCFDVMATQGYGFFSGPTDRRLRPLTLTFARPIYVRDVMVANGNAAKPIWISEAAWNPVDAPGVPDMPNRLQFGAVTQEQAARYMPLAYQRAQEEMPWLGVINYWFFKRPSDADQSQPYYYFRMVEPDFTPLPVYDSMKAYITSQTPTLYAGVHQGDSWAIRRDDDAEVIGAPGAQFSDALRTRAASFTFHGTDARIRWIGGLSDTLHITIDGADWGASSALNLPILSRITDADDWTEMTIHHSMAAETHTVELSADDGFLLDSVTVYDRSVEHFAPILAVGAALGALAGLG
ncbi:MAG: hypothetical protein IT319_03000, partial [Anaerolineae bacterium]|nr:hypothetical protein [Anaerolineae bacterium]